MITRKVLIELVSLAAYLETEAEKGRFPKRRFKRYSDALDQMVRDILKIAADEDEDEEEIV